MEKVLLEMPRISVFTDVLTDEEAAYYVDKYTKVGMNPDAGVESREQTYGQITEEVEQRSISWDTSPEDREFFKKRLAETVGFPIEILKQEISIDIHQDSILDCITTFRIHQKILHTIQKAATEKQQVSFG